MRSVGALVVAKIGAVAVIGAALRVEALLRGPGLDQRAVRGEVLVGHNPPRLPIHLHEESPRHIAWKSGCQAKSHLRNLCRLP
jgi:hypothetical protein